MTDLAGHVLEIAEDGTQTTTHPENDMVGCGFDEYVATGWDNMPGSRPSRWEFIRRTNDETSSVDWLGTRISAEEAQ